MLRDDSPDIHGIYLAEKVSGFGKRLDLRISSLVLVTVSSESGLLVSYVPFLNPSSKYTRTMIVCIES